MSDGYKVLKGIGLCPKCNVIYKLRNGQEPKDGIHRCRSCGNKINDLEWMAKNTAYSTT